MNGRYANRPASDVMRRDRRNRNTRTQDVVVCTDRDVACAYANGYISDEDAERDITGGDIDSDVIFDQTFCEVNDVILD